MNVRAELEKRTAPQARQTVNSLLERMEPQLARALPAQITPERFSRIVLTELQRSPALYDCDPQSLLGAMMLSAQLGLEPGPLGHVYLVPFKEKGAPRVTFIIGYKGMVALAYRSGEIKSLKAEIVYEHDAWRYRETETGTKFEHVPAPPEERGLPVAAWARGITRLGGPVVRMIWPSEWEAAKRRSPAGRNGSGPWATDESAMILKTAMRRLWPWLPTSAVVAHAFQADERSVPPDAIESESLADAIEAATLGEESESA